MRSAIIAAIAASVIGIGGITAALIKTASNTSSNNEAAETQTEQNVNNDSVKGAAEEQAPAEDNPEDPTAGDITEETEKTSDQNLDTQTDDITESPSTEDNSEGDPTEPSQNSEYAGTYTVKVSDESFDEIPYGVTSAGTITIKENGSALGEVNIIVSGSYQEMTVYATADGTFNGTYKESTNKLSMGGKISGKTTVTLGGQKETENFTENVTITGKITNGKITGTITSTNSSDSMGFTATKN